MAESIVVALFMIIAYFAFGVLGCAALSDIIAEYSKDVSLKRYVEDRPWGNDIFASYVPLWFKCLQILFVIGGIFSLCGVVLFVIVWGLYWIVKWIINFPKRFWEWLRGEDEKLCN